MEKNAGFGPWLVYGGVEICRWENVELRGIETYNKKYYH